MVLPIDHSCAAGAGRTVNALCDLDTVLLSQRDTCGFSHINNQSEIPLVNNYAIEERSYVIFPSF